MEFNLKTIINKMTKMSSFKKVLFTFLIFSGSNVLVVWEGFKCPKPFELFADSFLSDDLKYNDFWTNILAQILFSNDPAKFSVI